MKISLNWLRNYLEINHPAEKVAEILTDIGLEVEGVEQHESVKGGLKGVVVGEIKEVSPHPNADRLQLTKVDVGHADLLPIVCGAPNVAVGQKVPVALVGTTLYPDEKGFKIKKSKIRGEVSEGMICAEDELGLGTDHDGIMVLDPSVKVGTMAADYFDTKSDVVFEIGLTPNRIDAASHYGVARDLAAFLNMSEDVELKLPKINHFKSAENALVDVSVEDSELCPRYSGIVIDNLKVEDSPEWLKNNLKTIGVKPINNVVDVTNFVLHEIGQPLHAFDLDRVTGNKILVKRAKEGQAFVTLDEKERRLSGDDLMICNEKEAMCIAGVLGGLQSGVTKGTKAIFLESAYFNPVSIRKTAKRHALNTDASFRYERGADPNITLYALKRSALLLEEVAGGKIASEVTDLYPNSIEDEIVNLDYKELDSVIGQRLDRQLVQSILEQLEFKILHQNKESLRLQVPAYRVDVKRPIDIMEEVLRIYGYNNIKIPTEVRTSVVSKASMSKHRVEQALSDFLTSNGYTEILNNSLTNPENYNDDKDFVGMLNPLSKETEVLRKNLLYGGLQSIAYNLNRKQDRLKIYEWGKVYRKESEAYIENMQLGIWLSGNESKESWRKKQRKVDFYDLKEICEKVLTRSGLSRYSYQELDAKDQELFSFGLELIKNDQVLLRLGQVSSKCLQQFDIAEEVFFAEFHWDTLLKFVLDKEITHQPVSKFPPVRRDLALLLDKGLTFDKVVQHAKELNHNILRDIDLFDVYEGKNLPEGKKSYGVSFTFRDNKKTLTDKAVDQIMDELIKVYQSELKAELR